MKHTTDQFHNLFINTNYVQDIKYILMFIAR